MEQLEAAIKQAQKEVKKLTTAKRDFGLFVAATESILDPDRAEIERLTARMHTMSANHTALIETYEAHLDAVKKVADRGRKAGYATGNELFETQKAAVQRHLDADYELVKRAALEKDLACQKLARREEEMRLMEETFVEDILRGVKHVDESEDSDVEVAEEFSGGFVCPDDAW